MSVVSAVSQSFARRFSPSICRSATTFWPSSCLSTPVTGRTVYTANVYIDFYLVSTGGFASVTLWFPEVIFLYESHPFLNISLPMCIRIFCLFSDLISSNFGSGLPHFRPHHFYFETPCRSFLLFLTILFIFCFALRINNCCSICLDFAWGFMLFIYQWVSLIGHELINLHVTTNS